MSDVQTSPASADIGSAVESAEPSATADTVETSTAEVLSSAPEGVATQSTDETPQSPKFDSESWDGNISNLPEHLQGPVGALHKHLERGYTKKFQSLADERRVFDEAQKKWEGQQDTHRSDQEELRMLRNLLQGAEDPRLADFTEKNTSLTQELEKIQNEYSQFRELVERDIDEQAQQYAEQFKKSNAAIFESEEKRQVLSALLDNGWSPEDGVKLIGQPEKVVQLANELKEKGVPPNVAVEHAMLKAGSLARTPRPGAQMTSGARSRNNPESARTTVNDATSSREARLFAARAAMNWRTRK
jgi:hypothetical protein